MDTKTAWQTLRDYAEGRIGHTYAGSCPDHVEGHDSRDPECLVCQALEAVAGAAPAAVAPQGEYPHEQMDAMALDRYKVVPSNASMLWSHAVVAGDGTQQLYVGREVECQNMARKFAGAFLDGAFAFHSTAAAPTAQAAPALEAPESHTQALRAIADWPVTDMLMNMDAANMRGIAQRALAAAPRAPAMEAPAAPEFIDIGDGRQLRMDLDMHGAWQLFQGDSHIRYLNKFERNFVNSAIRATLAAAPQAPAAPVAEDARDAALWREHVEKLDALIAYCPTCSQGYIATAEMTRDQIIFECGKTAGRAEGKPGAEAAPAAPAVDAEAHAETLKKAARYDWLRGSNVANGTALAEHFGGSRMQDFDAKIAARAARAAQAKEGGEA